MRRKEKTELVLQRLSTVIEVPETELAFADPWQLLVAVALSAQCTDKRVNMVTPALFERFPSPASMVDAEFEEVLSYISSISYPANKARHLMGAARLLQEKHQGQVPRDFDDLLELPGVGRKTANVLASVLWNEPRMAVDTHVFRVANRLGLARAKTPQKVEEQLVRNIPPAQIPDAHHYLILHGRYTCLARKPKCPSCVLEDICTSKDKVK